MQTLFVLVLFAATAFIFLMAIREAISVRVRWLLQNRRDFKFQLLELLLLVAVWGNASAASIAYTVNLHREYGGYGVAIWTLFGTFYFILTAVILYGAGWGIYWANRFGFEKRRHRFALMLLGWMYPTSVPLFIVGLFVYFGRISLNMIFGWDGWLTRNDAVIGALVCLISAGAFMTAYLLPRRLANR